MYNEFRNDIKQLRSKALEWELTTINNKPCPNCRSFRTLFTIIATLIAITQLGQLSINFVQSVQSSLAILIGLLTTALIFSFDKFYAHVTKKSEDNWQLKAIRNQAYYFSQKFAYLTGYSILLCVLSLGISSLILLYPSLRSIEIFQLTPFQLMIYSGTNSIWIAWKILVFGINIYLTCVFLYLLIRISYITTYLISSLTIFQITELTRRHKENTSPKPKE